MWISERDKLISDAKEVAAQMGEGYEVHYFTQLEHNIKIGQEGPDAVVAIIHRDKGEIYFHSTAQVKTADTSKALDQTIETLRRLADKKGSDTDLIPNVSVTLEGKELRLTAARNPTFTEQFYIINAANSSIPKAQVDLLKQMGMRVKELQLDMTVEQFTHLTLDMVEAAIKSH